MKQILSESERERIAAAVAKAEQHTSGEIVPFIVKRSATYRVALWRGAGLCALIAGAVVLITRFIWAQYFWGLGIPPWLSGTWDPYIGLAAALAGMVAVQRVPAIHRKLAGINLIATNVHRRAMQAFVEKEVFATRDRTGILLFVSLFEHRIEVLGDSGVNAHVSPDEWVDVIKHVRDGIKADKLADGLVAGIADCGALLQRSGVEIRPDDVNELADDVAFGE